MRHTRPTLALILALGLGLPAAAQEAPAAPADTEQKADAGAYLAAQTAAIHRDYRAALALHVRALLADPQNPGLIEGAMISAASLGDLPRAITFAANLPNTSQTAQMVRVADEAAREDFAALLKGFSEGRQLGLVIDGLVSAWAELGRGEMSAALADFDKVAGTPGLESFGLYHKALALAQVGDLEGAEKILSGETAGPLRMLRRGVIAHAQILSQLERNADAVKLLAEGFPHGEDPGIDALRARLEAGETVPFDVTRSPKDGIAEVFYTLATALSGEAENNFTLLHTRIANYLRPDLTEALLLSAGLLEADGQYDLAVETYAQVPTDDQGWHLAEIGRAEALEAAGKTEAALEALRNLSRSHAGVLRVHVALGDMLRRAEKYDEAITAYTAALDLVAAPQEQHWVLFYTRGIAHERQKQWDEAEADFRKALALSPDQAQVLNYLGYGFIDMNRNLDEALAMIERAVELAPNTGYILDSLAWGYYRLGRYADALAPMEKASLMEPVDPIVTDHLGDVYWAVGRKLEARFQWRRALSFDPEEKEADRIRRKLEVGLDAVLAEEGAAPLKPVDAAANAD